jgi:hypothetical protein
MNKSVFPELDTVMHSMTIEEIHAAHPLPASRRERKYLPTFSDLVDRLTISQMKAIFIPERKREYVEEMDLILHDLDLILEEGDVRLNAHAIKAIIVIMLTNRFIWELESKVRDGSDKGSVEDQYNRLKTTHSINGVRNTAKNKLAAVMGGRHDYKIDCLASDLPEEFGNWDIFNGGEKDL